MCGITGIYYTTDRARNKLDSEIREMTSALTHRGPDDHGYYFGRRVALGHRRLSIIDLKGGHQPIFNEDKSMCIIFNGEIYNYKEIRIELLKKGHQFSTNSDTETILHAYEEWGEGCLNKLRGMFAFSIWDSKKETIFIARDRFGKKPVFYAQYGGKFVFSSEIKSILVDPHFKRTIDSEALASYFMFSYIPAPLTIFEGIYKLPAGSFMTVKNGQATVRKYWDLVFIPDRGKREKDFIPEFMDLLKESVKIRLMSEVPLGAFLSGGIDSSTVVALMSIEAREPVNTFTIGFGGDTCGFDDERKYARLVAEKYRTNHRECEVRPEIEGLLDKIVKSFDEPFADDTAIPSYFVYKTARENVTVALSGLGGDEAFCGYERYLGFHMSNIYNKIPWAIREHIIKTVAEGMKETSGGNKINHLKRFVRASSSGYAERYFGFVSRISEKYRDSFFTERSIYEEAFGRSKTRFLKHFDSPNAEEPLNKVFYSDIKTYLPDDILACTDRLSMRHSLEVRVPFLDHKLMEYCATIPPETKIKWFKKKYLLKKGVSHILPKPVLSHKKQGFVGPLSRWLQTDLKETTLDKLSEKNLKSHGLLDCGTVKNILEDHYSGKETNDTLIWSLLIFQAWFDVYMY